jgi:2-polyprenyl-3-methyl-5-hydroxy-6-metoxy-1,4-benzoquinol methylase
VKQQRSKKAAAKSSHWEHVGSWYDELVGQDGSEHHQNIIIPGVLRMLDLKAGDRLLDVACGQGVLCRAAAKTGVRAVGIDMAASLIDAANQRREDFSLETYAQGDARNLGACPAVQSGGFDAAACVLAIANITPLSPVWQGIVAALKPGGRLAVVLLHPCFRIPKKSSWQWDQQQQVQHRLVDGYLTSEKIPIAMHPGSDPGQSTTTFHRPLQAYINTMGSAGLWIDHLEEWISGKMPPKGVRFNALDKSRREIPLFLALRAVKAGR